MNILCGLTWSWCTLNETYREFLKRISENSEKNVDCPTTLPFFLYHFLQKKTILNWTENICYKPAVDRRSLLIWNLFSFFLNSVSQLDKNNTEKLPFTSSDLALCKITISGPGILTRIILPMNDLPSQEPNLNYCPTSNEGSLLPVQKGMLEVDPSVFLLLSPGRHWW